MWTYWTPSKQDNIAYIFIFRAAVIHCGIRIVNFQNKICGRFLKSICFRLEVLAAFFNFGQFTKCYHRLTEHLASLVALRNRQAYIPAGRETALNCRSPKYCLIGMSCKIHFPHMFQTPWLFCWFHNLHMKVNLEIEIYSMNHLRKSKLNRFIVVDISTAWHVTNTSLRNEFSLPNDQLDAHSKVSVRSNKKN